MGEIADSLIDGEFDFYTGEHIGPGIGYPRTLDGSLPWERRGRKPNPRYGVVNYISKQYVGRNQMPSSVDIAKKHANEMGYEYNTEQEMFEKISANFSKLVNWLKLNK